MGPVTDRELWSMAWWAVFYIGGLAALVTAMRVIFVPPKTKEGQPAERSPFQIWVEFSKERLKQETEADLEKYRIDKGLAHRRWEDPTP